LCAGFVKDLTLARPVKNRNSDISPHFIEKKAIEVANALHYAAEANF
jgi:hypothetical protein